jgi:hypothetical protein
MENRGPIHGVSVLEGNLRWLASAAKTALLLSPALLFAGCDDSGDADVVGVAQEESYEDVGERIVSSMLISSDRIRFDADAEPFELRLIPNAKLLSPDAVVVRDGVTLSPREAGLELPYRGYVVGDRGSWVRVSRTASGFEGLVYTDGELWEVRERDTGETVMRPAAIADFLDAPTGIVHDCASADAVHASHASDALLAPELAPVQVAAGCQQLSMAVVSDYTHVAKLGGAAKSESEMLLRINEADGVFRSGLNYGFVVGEVRSFSSQGGPTFNTAGAGSIPLVPFTSYKQSELPEFGLAHLFVARTSSGAVGQAYIGGACTSKAAGVSNYLGKDSSSSLIVTHEIGHNFGAKHDAEGAPFIMAPSVNGATKFSGASKTMIDAFVAKANCFTPCGAQPEPEQPEQPEQPEPEGPTCAGSCGEQSPDGCWCDDLCSGYGDCCGDFEQVCEPAGPSCAGSCGGQADGCWCDKACSKYGDCCDDYKPVCG